MFGVDISKRGLDYIGGNMLANHEFTHNQRWHWHFRKIVRQRIRMLNITKVELALWTNNLCNNEHVQHLQRGTRLRRVSWPTWPARPRPRCRHGSSQKKAAQEGCRCRRWPVHNLIMPPGLLQCMRMPQRWGRGRGYAEGSRFLVDQHI